MRRPKICALLAGGVLVMMAGLTSVARGQTPTFLFHTAEDRPVPVENSLRYFAALVSAGVPAELHVFERGRHGIGLAAEHGGASAWPELCAQWLRSHQWIAP